MKIIDIELQILCQRFRTRCKNVLRKERKYTMRDIGRLENRIQRLEDYTTLNLLEVLKQKIFKLLMIWIEQI